MKEKYWTWLGLIFLLVGLVIWFVFHQKELGIGIGLLSFTCYAMDNEKWQVIKRLSWKNVCFIGTFLILCVAVAFGFIQLAKFMIDDILHLYGLLKTIAVWIAIIIIIYPIKFIFAFRVDKIWTKIKTSKKRDNSHIPM